MSSLFGEIIVEDNNHPKEDVIVKEEKIDDKDKDLKDSSDKKEVKEEIPDLKAEEDIIEETPVKTEEDYKELAERLVNEGLWKPFEIEEDFVLDEDGFKALREQQNILKTQELEKKVFSKLSDEEKAFLEFRKNGGNLEEYLNTFNIKKAVGSIDITTDDGKKSSIYSYYKNMVGWNDKKIARHIKGLEADMELDEEAEFTKSKLDAKAKELHQNTLQKTEQQKKAREKAQTDYINGIKSSLKERKVTTKEVNKIVKDFTEVDERGFAEVDKAFLSFRNDPEKVQMLWEMLLDTDNFIKKQTQKVANEVTKKNFKILMTKQTKQNNNTNTDTKGDWVSID